MVLHYGLVDGKPLYNADETRALIPESEREGLAHSFIDVLADLHQVDPDEVALASWQRDSYVGRQLKTWYRSGPRRSQARTMTMIAPTH